MEISKQIKKYRAQENLSQEELAEKIFVSRQTISNWENDKNYPDIKSLLLISNSLTARRSHSVSRINASVVPIDAKVLLAIIYARCFM